MKKLMLTLLFIPSFSHANITEIESYKHQKQIEILQKAEVCIKNAGQDKDKFRACEKEEAKQRKALNQEVFNKRKASILQRLSMISKCVENSSSNHDLAVCKKNWLKNKGRPF